MRANAPHHMMALNVVLSLYALYIVYMCISFFLRLPQRQGIRDLLCPLSNALPSLLVLCGLQLQSPLPMDVAFKGGAWLSPRTRRLKSDFRRTISESSLLTAPSPSPLSRGRGKTLEGCNALTPACILEEASGSEVDEDEALAGEAHAARFGQALDVL
jgi:hypothetical protein